jgi:hypothetical protein
MTKSNCLAYFGIMLLATLLIAGASASMSHAGDCRPVIFSVSVTERDQGLDGKWRDHFIRIGSTTPEWCCYTFLQVQWQYYGPSDHATLCITARDIVDQNPNNSQYKGKDIYYQIDGDCALIPDATSICQY